MPPITTLAEAEEFVGTTIRSGIKLGLENTRRLLAALGDPQLGRPVIHVAGTNGKGSTCSMLATALSAAGYRTGLNTSPHMVHLRERSRVDGLAMSPEVFTRLVAEMQARAGHLFDPETNEQTPTFFEVTTALAFMHFRDAQTDVDVIEVGMGGRLDSTNVVAPCLTIITAIDFDHVQALGDTLTAIAGEKAGIIKQGVPLITSAQQPEALARINAVAAERAAPTQRLNTDFAGLRAELDADRHGPLQHNTVRSGDETRVLTTRLVGAHQLENAAVVHAALCQLRRDLPGLDVDRAVAGLPRLVWPARLQTMPDGVVIDGSHNAQGIQATFEILARLVPGRRYTVLFGSLSAKPWPDMLRVIAPVAERIHIVAVDHPMRAADPAEQIAWLREHVPDVAGELMPDPAAGLAALRAAPHGLVIGSLYLAGEVLAGYTQGEPCPILIPEPD